MSLFAVGSRDYSFYACNQFIRIEQQFFSKVSLSGKTLYVGPSFDGECDCDSQPSPAASISYPFAPGVYEMSGPGNGVMMIEVTNDKVFKIVWDFFNNGSATSQACNFEPEVNGLQLCVGYNETLAPTQTQQQNDPCATNNQCWIGVCASIGLGASCDCNLDIRYEDAVTGFPVNGLVPGNSTKVILEGSGLIGNTFFVGNCTGGYNVVTADTVGELEGIPGGVTEMGRGFIGYEAGTQNFVGWFTIGPGQAGRYYVVYSDGCQYNTCLIDIDNNNENPDPDDDPIPCNIPAIFGDVSCSITVADQPPVSACCVSAPSGTSVEVSVTMDVAGYNSQVVALGGTGDFATNFVGGGVCVGSEPSESECSGGVTRNGSTLTWSGGIPDEDTYLSFSYTFSVANADGELCEHVIIKHVLLRPNVQTDINLVEWRDQGGNPIEGPYCLGDVTSITGIFSGPDGDTFTVTPGDGLAIAGSSGSFAGGEGSVTVNTEGLNPFQNYCFEIESNGDGDPGPDPDPDQGECACPNVSLEVSVTQPGTASAGLNVNYNINNVPGFTHVIVSTESTAEFSAAFQFSNASGNFTHNAGLSGGSVLVDYFLTIFDSNGCVYRFYFYISLTNTTGSAIFCTADCDQGVPGNPVEAACSSLDTQEECPNFPGLDISCADGIASVAPSGNVNSPIDNDFVYFDSTGSATTDERLDLAVRIVSFTDGCPELIIYECSLCDEDEDIDLMLECMDENTPDINCIFDDETRILELEESGEVVDVVTDVTEYSIDGGVTYVEYTTPFVVADGVTEVLWRRTTNYSLCPQTIIEGVCNLPGSPDPQGCVDQNPTLTCSFDANSNTHSAQIGGTVTNVLNDEVTYNNGVGPQPYTPGQQISGDAVAFNRIVEFLNNCPTICLSCLSLSNRLVDPCIIDPETGDPIPNPDFINNTTVNVTVEIPPDSIVVNVEVPPDSINVVCAPNVNVENIIDACCPEPEDPATIDCDPIPTSTCQ